MTQFDPLKAQMEIVSSFTDICGVLRTRMQFAATRMADAETEMNAFTKLLAFAEDQRLIAARRLNELRVLAEQGKQQ